MSDLKPCPHCGELPDIVETNSGFQALCSGCDMATYSDDWTEEKAIEIWNARHSGWISVDDVPINGSYNWNVGDKAIGWNEYAFEIEWDGDYWCSIGGDTPTHWIPLPKPPKQ